MSVDTDLLLYSLTKTFHSSLGISISDDTEKYLTKKKGNKIPQDDKLYFTTYSLKLAQSLTEYIPKISQLEINTDSSLDYNFKLESKKCGTKCVSLLHSSIVIRDIIPKNLMKICKYRKNSKTYLEFTTSYEEICAKIYSKINSEEKYSDVADKQKQKVIFKPITDLIVNTLTKKRKCAVPLYNYLFGEQERIVIKLYKKRFMIYDFGVELPDPEIKSFKLKQTESDELILTFNNGAEFMLTLHTNSTDIKEHISLKFHTKFSNMNELFSVKTGSI